MSLTATASQTVGPFFQIGFAWSYRADLFPTIPAHDPRRIVVTGHVFDGDGLPIVDAVLELWQADVEGRFATSADAQALSGFGRVPTDQQGAFRFETIKPGRISHDVASTAPRARQLPHIGVIVSMRGLLRPVKTRIYFPDDISHENDAALALVPAERRHTLFAAQAEEPRPNTVQRAAETVAARTLRWDVHMQGEQETVFFDY